MEKLCNLAEVVEKAMKLSFSEIEQTLCGLHGIPSEAQTQFRARLRNLLRVGIDLPGGGRGRRANYHPADLFKLAFAVELLQAGVPPEKAALSVARYWPKAVEQIFAVRKALQGKSPIALYLVAEPRSLTEPLLAFRPETGEALAKRLANGGLALSTPRLVVINPAALLNSIPAFAALAGVDMDAFGASLDHDQEIILTQGAHVGPVSGFIDPEGN